MISIMLMFSTQIVGLSKHIAECRDSKLNLQWSGLRDTKMGGVLTSFIKNALSRKHSVTFSILSSKSFFQQAGMVTPKNGFPMWSLQRWFGDFANISKICMIRLVIKFLQAESLKKYAKVYWEKWCQKSVAWLNSYFVNPTSTATCELSRSAHVATRRSEDRLWTKTSSELASDPSCIESPNW